MRNNDPHIERYAFLPASALAERGRDGWFATPGGNELWDVFSLTFHRRVLKDLPRPLAEQVTDDHNSAEKLRGEQSESARAA